MGKALLICRLAARDLRHRRAQAVLLLVAVATATTTLTLGLALHGATSQPYQQTRAAAAGPDVVADVQVPPGSGPPASLTALARARGVIGYSGPYLLAFPVLDGSRYDDSNVMVEGRDAAPAAADQPKLTQGTWIRPGQVVIERSYADLLGIRAGDRITLDGRSFRVAGVAVTAAVQPRPVASISHPAGFPNPLLIWATQADARSLAASARLRYPAPQFYTLNLKLANPAAAQAFASAHAAAGMFLALALIAAAAGLAAGWLAAPLLTSPGAGLVGTAGAPSLTVPSVALVTAVALTVVAVATAVPAIRAARTSTTSALADAARPPRHRARLTAFSARLPVPLLLGGGSWLL